MARRKIVGNRSNEEIRGLAEGRLISRRHCSKYQSDYYCTPSYGDDMNTLDMKRVWIYNEMRELQPDADTEQLRIMANKLLLYLNPEEIQNEIAIIEEEQAQAS